ncbi:EVE domain-containing protein [Halobacillus halophilus]|uniref:EVE domain-containing protein n=1 Tax=Halobacillus halophilus TaxID=1570 RepID=UPI001CD6394E|nr:EVE domain-containing protein [Halobacillus halophilus]MCA1010664.1 EVE domain-containing protein [Halobacillus halophilus]
MNLLNLIYRKLAPLGLKVISPKKYKGKEKMSMLYYLDHGERDNLRMLKRSNLNKVGWKEKDLEELLVKNLDRILDEETLMPIFTERSFQEEPDIMALDHTGKLYIFELKRWKSNEENLLQVFRYGQIYGQKNYEDLEKLFLKFNPNSDSLVEEHREYFKLTNEESINKEQFNHQQHFLIVTDGTDVKTRNAVNYWKKTGLNIDSIVYRVFVTDSNEQLIEFNAYSPFQDVIEMEQSNFILNTNYKNNPHSHDEMMNEEKAAAYYHPWKNKIKRIQKGDKVFLYQSGKGIVAMGIGTGEVHMKEYQGKNDEEYYMKLEDFNKLKHPLSAKKMKDVTDSNFMFNQTLFSVDKEKSDLIWKYIKDNHL